MKIKGAFELSDDKTAVQCKLWEQTSRQKKYH